MALLALAIAAALEIGGMRAREIADAGVMPFVLAAVAGALGAWVASTGFGALGGALTGASYALGAGIVRLALRGGGNEIPAVLTAILLMAVIGSVLGVVGALPVALTRSRRARNEE
jgi:hypothetical protein